ncbi:glycosyltransferase family 2 protein [Flavobacterium sp. GT3R68]|uniref:glycosyltransferase family 2 protein n=1 Tax=Flavobacterium sp. GT3R68 TaxID=2594437 RepID=UPI000F899C3A|nr:glycosyltransferase family A protein [Flavobacterium sp. GT3R68]RTY92263.1 glycosyltransferase family 2 protein [Flavobacterium sp. GSN2]TRW92499.1 glycosyltransferase [Flavobacterium sp. GT3R68]
MSQIKFSILITTKNRKPDLKFTLDKIQNLLDRPDVECIICDDGSTDGTYAMVAENFPKIQLLRNAKSRGLIYSRNVLLELTKGLYAISLDDDAHFLSEHPLEKIEECFDKNERCGIVAFRMFWGRKEPETVYTSDQSEKVRGFVGGGHAWNMKAWKDIPDYPAWFIFYGEEDFASFHLFKKGWDIIYLPEVLANHRVDIKGRKKDTDYRQRVRRAIRSGWYLYFMFFPWKVIPKKLVYTLWVQIKIKVFKGDFQVAIAILQAIGDLLINIPRIIGNRNRLSVKEFEEFSKLPTTKLYWSPEDETSSADSSKPV